MDTENAQERPAKSSIMIPENMIGRRPNLG